jgi:hypothetical protein
VTAHRTRTRSIKWLEGETDVVDDDGGHRRAGALRGFGVLGFGWRSWLQHRRTGSAGFRGVSGRVGSVEWIAGVGFPLALAVAVGAPMLQCANVIEPISFLCATWIQVTGIVVAVVGIAATVYA